MTPLVTFIGRHNSGKTSIIRAVAGRLGTKGYRVAVIKSTKHHGLSIRQPGSDSDLFKGDGVPCVALVGPQELIAWQDVKRQPLRRIASGLFSEADLVIGEGFKHEPGVAKIEVARGGASGQLLGDSVKGVVAVVADFPVAGVPLFAPDQVEEIAAFVEGRFIRPEGSEEEVSLLVNGRDIPLGDDIKRSLTGLIFGFVDAIKEIERPTEVQIRIRKGGPPAR